MIKVLTVGNQLINFKITPVQRAPGDRQAGVTMINGVQRLQPFICRRYDDVIIARAHQIAGVLKNIEIGERQVTAHRSHDWVAGQAEGGV